MQGRVWTAYLQRQSKPCRNKNNTVAIVGFFLAIALVLTGGVASAYAIDYPSQGSAYTVQGNVHGTGYFLFGRLSQGTTLSSTCFSNVTIPNGATITSAFLTFTPTGGTPTTPLNSQWHAWATDNASLITLESEMITAHSQKTAMFTTWNVPVLPSGTPVSSPDFAPTIQEIVDRSGWASGNGLCLLIGGLTSADGAYRYGAPTNPVLSVDFSLTPTPTPTPPPTPTPTPTPTITPAPTAPPATGSATLTDEIGFQFLGQVLSFSVGLISYIFLASNLKKL